MPQDRTRVTQLGTMGFRFGGWALPFMCALSFVACADEHGAEPRNDARVFEPQVDAQASSDDDGGALQPTRPEAGAALDGDVDADADIDAAVDAGSDSRVAPPPELGSCEAAAIALDQFVAQHRSCSVDSDCALVGDCSHSDFRAVSRDAEKEATRLVQEGSCSRDGPGAHALCNAGKCETVRSLNWCGQAPIAKQCPPPTTLRHPGCDAVTLPKEGCYADCIAVGNSAGCPRGFDCQETSIDPCHGKSCDACGQRVTLCQPSSECELELGVSFRSEGTTFVKLARDEAVYMYLTLTNRTDRTLQLGFDMPCYGPVVRGFNNYDLWGACLAGACPEPNQRVQLTLKPREALTWRKVLVVAPPSSCNPQGLYPGTYTPSFELGNLAGAISCGPATASLTVR